MEELIRGRRSRDISPDRNRVMKIVKPPPPPPLIRKVQVVYYLSRNGQLDHPHFMEIFLHSNHHFLRLQDVMERLTALRGKGMSSLYSWSFKRSFKNGYVWNDLSENDIIYPTEGAEYVLKGSNLLQNCTEKLQQLNPISHNKPTPQPRFHPKTQNQTSVYQTREQDDDDDENDETDEIEESSKPPNELMTLSDHSSSSPPSTTSSEITTLTTITNVTPNTVPDDTHITESIPSRNTGFLQFIACGGRSSVGVAKSKKLQNILRPEETTNVGGARITVSGRKSDSSLFKDVVCKNMAVKNNSEDEMMINCMSMNPRFGNLQSEEKEYFSGSIVESMADERSSRNESVVKRSNSYNEERNTKIEFEEATVKEEEEMNREKKRMLKGKCINIFKTM